MLHGRLISNEHNEPPNIDVNLEHEWREEVIQYIYEMYGRDGEVVRLIAGRLEDYSRLLEKLGLSRGIFSKSKDLKKIDPFLL